MNSGPPMPFEQYFRDDHPTDSSSYSSQPPTAQNAPRNATAEGFAIGGGVAFQLPRFITDAPTLALGGGAEAFLPGQHPQGLAAPTPLWRVPNYYDYQPSSPSAYTQSSTATTNHAAFQQAPAPPSQAQTYQQYYQPWTAPSFSTPPPDLTSNESNITLPLHGPPTHAFNAYAQPSPLALNLPFNGGLPVYSTSGLDIVAILSAVHNRPNPQVTLGAVDLTVAFVLVDIRRYDQPIVYASPMFYALTGYYESEVLGHNCRFLQAPGGGISKGDGRKYTQSDAVAHLARAVAAGKEAQVQLVNYKKDGRPFMNLVSMVPVPLHTGANGWARENGETGLVMGFQVDLNSQPNAVLTRQEDGTIHVNYDRERADGGTSHSYNRKGHAINRTAVSGALKAILNERWINKIADTEIDEDEPEEGSMGIAALPRVLLAASPDFIHVLSLKGHFLYCAPAVKRVLGYDAAELIGQSIQDYTHEADVVPLMRELKEASGAHPALVAEVMAGQDKQPTGVGMLVPQVAKNPPKPVDLLLRIKHKQGGYVWLQARGRLHIEPGKGRKAIILSGRRQPAPNVAWDKIAHALSSSSLSLFTPAPTAYAYTPLSAGSSTGSTPPSTYYGGLAASSTSAHVAMTASSYATSSSQPFPARPEDVAFWALLGPGRIARTVLSAGSGVREVLGYGPMEVIGQVLRAVEGAEFGVAARGSSPSESGPASISVRCRIRKRDRGEVEVEVELWESAEWDSSFVKTAMQGRTDGVPAIALVRLLSSSSAGQYHPAHPANAPPKLVTLPSGGVLDAMDTTQQSSWQFELQKVKRENLKLEEEIAELEARAEERTLLLSARRASIVHARG